MPNLIEYVDDLEQEIELVAVVYNETDNIDAAWEAFVSLNQSNGWNPVLTEEQFAFVWSGIGAMTAVYLFKDGKGNWAVNSNFQ